MLPKFWEGVLSRTLKKLEQVQLPDARIVTGLPIVTSKDSLYFETALSTLSSRRKIVRLKAIFKVDENIIPTYVQYLFYEKHCSTTSNFTIGNSQNDYLSKCRLQVYKSSCVPTVIRIWKSLL